jgi:hypothetical protein
MPVSAPLTVYFSMKEMGSFTTRLGMGAGLSTLAMMRLRSMPPKRPA